MQREGGQLASVVKLEHGGGGGSGLRPLVPEMQLGCRQVVPFWRLSFSQHSLSVSDVMDSVKAMQRGLAAQAAQHASAVVPLTPVSEVVPITGPPCFTDSKEQELRPPTRSRIHRKSARMHSNQCTCG